jgi:hypothetical protein
MRWLAVALALTTMACGGSDDAEAPSGSGRGPFSAAAAAPTPPRAPPTSPRSRSRGPDPVAHGAVAPAIVPGPIGSTTRVDVTETTTEAHERDLGVELANAIGSPASCIDLETARSLHGHLRVHVTATVMATGSITRATATGSGLSREALACVEARALAAHLAAPIERAPRGVSASLDYDVSATDDTRTTSTPDFVLQPGAVAPGVVTPAVGPDRPVEGRVTPSSTLPATGGAGRPEGSVAPDIVLPARTP